MAGQIDASEKRTRFGEALVIRSETYPDLKHLFPSGRQKIREWEDLGLQRIAYLSLFPETFAVRRLEIQLLPAGSGVPELLNIFQSRHRHPATPLAGLSCQ